MRDDVHDRTRRYFGKSVHSQIRKQTVLVIGAGAVGNEVVKNLMMLGLSKIFLVDDDVVELSNLNRCVFFRPEDCEKKTPKVLAVKREVENFHPDTKSGEQPPPSERTENNYKNSP